MNRPVDFPAPPQPAPGPAPAGRDASSLIMALQQHRRQPREDGAYWATYCALMRALCRATAVLLVQRGADGWSVLGAEAEGDDWALRNWEKVLEKRGERTLDKGFAFTPMQDENGRLRILAVIQTSGIGDAQLVIDIPETERAQLNELLMRAMLSADLSPPDVAPVPDRRKTSQSEAGGTAVLDLAAQVVAEQHFGAATLVLVNGLAASSGASQVALGWLADGALRTVAISHLDRFERNTENVQLMDDTFMELLGQPGPVWHGADAEPQLAVHAKLARILNWSRLYTLPLADSTGKVGAVLLFGFVEDRATPPEAAPLQLTMGFLQPWLEQLRQRDRWWGARLRDWAGRKLARWIGPGKVWGRTFAVILSALLLYVVFGTMDYRIESSSQLTTDSTRLISAQFDGRIDSVAASTGDVVKAGALLATLDTRELRQQQLELTAERQRLEAEADKARAAGNLAELGVAEARWAQADARLTRIAQYLAQARAVAPFDGVVVAGERKDLINAPVKKGDNLFRVARIDGLYVEIMVPERDVRYVQANARGELRLLSRPDQTIPFTLSNVIPMAQVKGQEGNHFLVKARLDHAPEAWWRPGMSGMAVIDGGRQNVGWVLTHRLVDGLRMKLWWLG